MSEPTHEQSKKLFEALASLVLALDALGLEVEVSYRALKPLAMGHKAPTVKMRPKFVRDEEP